MSWLSEATGIHISPHGVKIEPLKALGTVATLGSFGALGPVAGALGAIPGVGAIANAAGKIPGVSAIGNAIGHAGGLSDVLKGVAGKIPGVLQGALSHPLETAGVVSGALDQAKARGLITEAINAARENYDSRSGLRTKGVQGLLNPQAPDLSGIDYGSSRSVYGRRG